VLKYIDIHSHINFPQFNADRDRVLERMEHDGCGTITVGTTVATSQEAIALADKYPFLFATVGVHPTEVISERGNDLEAELRELASHPRVVAIGECGLDYARLKADTVGEKKRQQDLFALHLELAIDIGKPLMIHCRKAYPDVLAILSSKKREYGEKLRGDFHFFTESVEVARPCLDLGFMLSFTGPITYGNDYADTIRFVPLDKMMVETDAPFAAPLPHRGKRNEPSYVHYVVERIAELRGDSADHVRSTLLNNSLAFFGINGGKV